MRVKDFIDIRLFFLLFFTEYECCKNVVFSLVLFSWLIAGLKILCSAMGRAPTRIQIFRVQFSIGQKTFLASGRVLVLLNYQAGFGQNVHARNSMTSWLLKHTGGFTHNAKHSRQKKIKKT